MVHAAGAEVGVLLAGFLDGETGNASAPACFVEIQPGGAEFLRGAVSRGSHSSPRAPGQGARRPRGDCRAERGPHAIGRSWPRPTPSRSFRPAQRQRA